MSLLSPSSIAVIGASAQEGKVGHEIFKNLVTQGFKGELYPINPKSGEILGKKVYASVSEIPGKVDLVVIVTPAPTVVGLIEECGKKKIPSVIVITAGFGEIHEEEGKKREKELHAMAKKYDIQLVGANCLGVLRPSIGMNASFGKDMPPDGSIALISQSGALAVALMDASPGLHLGYSTVFSIGNKTLLDESDYLEICEKDEKTKVIGLYLESIKDGQRFREVAARVAAKKPIVLLKSGVSEHGKKAASSHTGALAGMDASIDAVCAQAGIRRAHSAQELLDMLRVLSSQPALLSPDIVVITNAGGPGILATDAAEKEGLRLVSLDPKTQARLKPSLPSTASMGNPIDVIGDAGADRFEAALKAAGEDPNVDGVVVLLTPQVMTPCVEIADTVAKMMRKYSLMPVTAAFMGGETIKEAENVLAKHGIPNFPTPERAMAAMAALRPRQSCVPEKKNKRSARANKAAELLKGRQGLLSEHLTQELFSLYDLPLPEQEVAHSPAQAVAIAKRIGYPVIAKVSSPDIAHKTDIGGIRANLKTDADVEAAVKQIEENVRKHAPEATMRGVLIQKFLPVGNEFIIGAIRDPSFGPLIMVGLGGIYTELFRDTSFRLAPLGDEEAYDMLQSLKAWKLLLGMRGAATADIASLAEILVTLSHMASECPMIREIDCNPVLVGEKQVVIADVKVIVED